jgi:probable F420-dependent oxidoreductase
MGAFAEEAAACRALEQAGYSTLWVSEGNNTREALVHAALLLAHTGRALVGTSIASIWARDPAATANAARSLAEAYPNRFALGLGVSHSQVVNARGHAYAKPLQAMRDFLAGMDAATYGPPDLAPPVPRLVAALAPKMLALAAEHADGTHTMHITPEHTAWVREQIGPDPLVVPKVSVLLADDAGEARTIARAALAPYLGLENYLSSWRRLGFVDADFVDGASDTLVDALVAWGDRDAIHARVEAHFAAGADHVVLNPVGGDPLGLLLALAPER